MYAIIATGGKQYKVAEAMQSKLRDFVLLQVKLLLRSGSGLLTTVR